MDVLATVLLSVVIAMSWLGATQLARTTELAPGCGGHSCTHLVVWLNGSSWMLLGVPWLTQRFYRRPTRSRPGYRCGSHARSRARSQSPSRPRSSIPLTDLYNDKNVSHARSRARSQSPSRSRSSIPLTDLYNDKNVSQAEPNHLVDMWTMEESSDEDHHFDVDQSDDQSRAPYLWRHVVLLFVLAVSSNFAYIVALGFVSASLHTAVFAVSPLFTLVLSVVFLDEKHRGQCEVEYLTSSLRWVSVGLSISGVILISQPWVSIATSASSESSGSDAGPARVVEARLAGSVLVLVAAVGTSVYQVTFKKIMGERLSGSPAQLGLLMAKLGSHVFVVYGAALFGTAFAGVYSLDFDALPYGLLVDTALTTLVFNCVVNFGLSNSSPVVVSLAAQLGIPLNVVIAVVFKPMGLTAPLNGLAVIGVVFMIASFALNMIAGTKEGTHGAVGAIDGQNPVGHGEVPLA